MKLDVTSLRAYLRKTTECVLCGTLLSFGAVRAQQPAGAGANSRPLPDTPQAKQDSGTNANGNGSARFVGYITKRSLFFPDIAASPGPLSTWQKFQLFGNQAISPETILTSAISAGVSQARDVPYAYGEGGEAYGKRFGASMARGASTAERLGHVVGRGGAGDRDGSGRGCCGGAQRVQGQVLVAEHGLDVDRRRWWRHRPRRS